VDEAVKVGQQVRLLYSRALGVVREIDHVYEAARVELPLGLSCCSVENLGAASMSWKSSSCQRIGEQHE
jgi:hypothetical protein